MTDHAESLPEPDYDAAVSIHFAAIAHGDDGWMGTAIDVACKPLYDRIAELEAIIATVNEKWLPQHDRLGERVERQADRIDRYQRDLAAIEQYAVDHTPVSWKSELLDMVRQAQRGDTP